MWAQQRPDRALVACAGARGTCGRWAGGACAAGACSSRAGTVSGLQRRAERKPCRQAAAGVEASRTRCFSQQLRKEAWQRIGSPQNTHTARAHLLLRGAAAGPRCACRPASAPWNTGLGTRTLTRGLDTVGPHHCSAYIRCTGTGLITSGAHADNNAVHDMQTIIQRPLGCRHSRERRAIAVDVVLVLRLVRGALRAALFRRVHFVLSAPHDRLPPVAAAPCTAPSACTLLQHVYMPRSSILGPGSLEHGTEVVTAPSLSTVLDASYCL